MTMYNAGHILGSAMVHLHVGNGLHNILYSGDQKYGRTLLLEPAVTMFPRLETLMLEATYGGKDNIMPHRQETDEELMNVIKETVERNGKVLIPTLGVGRAQEVMLAIEQMAREGRMAPVPVYIDGMVWDVTAIHTAYPEYLNNSVRKLIFHKDQNPFLHEIFKRVGSQKERMDVIENTGSCVILATSGMLTGGPSVDYLHRMAEDPRNTLMFVGYQAEGSLGRKIMAGIRQIPVNDKNGRTKVMNMNMRIESIQGFSGHSDRPQLVGYVRNLKPTPKRILVNHGDRSKTVEFAKYLSMRFKVNSTSPRNLDTIRLK